jgi:NADH-ubiquinone oxidoreductase chain 6
MEIFLPEANSIFFVLTLIASILSITAKNPVISIAYLIITFVLAAGYILLLGINFIGISYIIVYVGAIAVLFLFIIMMINIKLSDILDYGNQYTKVLPLGLIVITIFFYYFNNIIPFMLDNQNFSLDFLINNFSSKNLIFDSSLLDLFSLYSNEIVSISQIDNVGFNMYVDSAILLIIVSLILLFSMIAAIIISYYKEKEE